MNSTEIVTFEIPNTIQIKYSGISRYLASVTQYEDCFFVAGGAARKIYAEMEGDECTNVNDMDIYTKSERLINFFTFTSGDNGKRGNRDSFDKLNNVAHSVGFSSVQIHTKYPCWAVPALFETFDFEVCRFATNFRNIYTTKQAINDYRTSTLTSTSSENKHAQSLYRIRKYLDKGFHPTPSLILDRLGTSGEVLAKNGFVEGYGKNS